MQILYNFNWMQNYHRFCKPQHSLLYFEICLILSYFYILQLMSEKDMKKLRRREAYLSLYY